MVLSDNEREIYRNKLKELNETSGYRQIRTIMLQQTQESILRNFHEGRINPCAAYRLLPFDFITQIYSQIEQLGVDSYINLISGEELTLFESLQIHALNNEITNTFEPIQNDVNALTVKRNKQQEMYNMYTKIAELIGELEQSLNVKFLREYGIGKLSPSDGQLKKLKEFKDVKEYFDSQNLRLNYNFYFMYMKELINFRVMKSAALLEWCEEFLKLARDE